MCKGLKDKSGDCIEEEDRNKSYLNYYEVVQVYVRKFDFKSKHTLLMSFTVISEHKAQI